MSFDDFKDNIHFNEYLRKKKNQKELKEANRKKLIEQRNRESWMRYQQALTIQLANQYAAGGGSGASGSFAEVVQAPVVPGIVTQSLAVSYDLTNASVYPGTGTTIYDLSGNSNDGVIVNSLETGWNSNGYFTYDGTDDYIYSSTQVSGPQVFSIDVWFRTSTTANRKIVGFENTVGNPASFWDRMLYIDTNNKLKFGIFDGFNTKVATSTTTVTDGNWHHAVGTYSNVTNTGVLYIDGSQEATLTSNNAQSYNGYWKIGAWRSGTEWPQSNANAYFTGDIGNVTIYDVVLDSDDVTQNYNAFSSTYS